MKIILDTNIFISGIFWEGNFCSQIINKWKEGKFKLISSPEIIEEFVETLRSFKIQVDEEIINGWKNIIIQNSILVKPLERLEIIKTDLDDNKFLEAAIEGKADFIISQDNHLLNLKEYGGIKIINPKEFLEIIS